MNSKKRSRRVNSEKIRGLLQEIADAVCESQNRVTLAMCGNTFEIHLDCGSINITINEEGGRR